MYCEGDFLKPIYYLKEDNQNQIIIFIILFSGKLSRAEQTQQNQTDIDLDSKDLFSSKNISIVQIKPLTIRLNNKKHS